MPGYRAVAIGADGATGALRPGLCIFDPYRVEEVVRRIDPGLRRYAPCPGLFIFDRYAVRQIDRCVVT